MQSVQYAKIGNTIESLHLQYWGGNEGVSLSRWHFVLEWSWLDCSNKYFKYINIISIV